MVIVDGDLRVCLFNTAAERIWGQDRASVLGRHVSGLGLGDLQQLPGVAPLSDRKNREDTRQKSLHQRTQERRSEISITRKDGSRIRAALSLANVEVGGQSCTIAFVRDITAEVERRERMALLTSVADRTNRGVIVTDPNLQIVYTNAAFRGTFGYSVEEVQGRRANELLLGRHTDRRTLVRLRRRIDDKAVDEEEILTVVLTDFRAVLATLVPHNPLDPMGAARPATVHWISGRRP